MLLHPLTVAKDSIEFPRVTCPTLKQKLHQLKKINNWLGFFRLTGNYIICALAIVASHLCPYLYPIVVVLIGSRLRALENLTHEASHRQLFKNRILNDGVATLFGAFPTHSSLDSYRNGHRIHHRYLGHPEKDPDLNKYGYLPVPSDRQFKHLMAVFTATYDLKANLISFTQPLTNPTSPLELCLRMSFWLICGSIILLTHTWQDFILFYVIPFLTSYRIIRQLVDMSEHILNNDVTHHTRNVLCNPVLQFIIYPHADYLHLLHHMYPGIPGNALLKAHKLLLEQPEYKEVPPFRSYFFGRDSVLSMALSQ